MNRAASHPAEKKEPQEAVYIERLLQAERSGHRKLSWQMVDCVIICSYNQIPLIPLQVGTDTPSLRKADPKGRSALLADIQQGTRLRKVTQINDRSAPQIESKWATGPGLL